MVQVTGATEQLAPMFPSSANNRAANRTSYFGHFTALLGLSWFGYVPYKARACEYLRALVFFLFFFFLFSSSPSSSASFTKLAPHIGRYWISEPAKYAHIEATAPVTTICSPQNHQRVTLKRLLRLPPTNSRSADNTRHILAPVEKCKWKSKPSHFPSSQSM